MLEIKSSTITTDVSDVDGISIIGTYEGECADANVTNANGLDITREVWETVFSSEEYDNAIKNGWYIGYLGHPEDPDCQDFQQACIVMTECRIDDDGIIRGKFNLLNTPVGRIVKVFINAGVNFGISVRGSGNIIGNSVEPESFAFRGFDLVAFPAYSNAVPQFSAIAASSNSEERAKYTKICAAVEADLSGIGQVSTIEQVQSVFAKQSDTYKALDKRLQEIRGCESANLPDITQLEESPSDVPEDMEACKIQSLLNLIYSQNAEIACLRSRLAELECANAASQDTVISQQLEAAREEANLYASKKVTSVSRFLTNQVRIASSAADKYANKSEALERKNRQLESVISENTAEYARKLADMRKENLVYRKKAEAVTASVEHKDEEIRSLRSQLSETVRKLKIEASRTSNLDEKISSLNGQLSDVNKKLRSFQTVYTELYCSATGVDVRSVPITAATSVQDIRSSIGSQSRLEAYSSPTVPTAVELEEDYEGEGLITI